MGRQAGRDRLGQRGECARGSGIGGCAPARGDDADAGDEDDAAPAARLHVRDGTTHGDEGGGELGGKEGFQLVVAGLLDGLGEVKRGTGNQDVEPATGCGDACDGIGDGGTVGDVEGGFKRLAAGSLDFAAALRHDRGVAAVDRHGGAEAGQASCRRGTKAAGRTGDERGAAGKVEGRRQVHGRSGRLRQSAAAMARPGKAGLAKGQAWAIQVRAVS